MAKTEPRVPRTRLVLTLESREEQTPGGIGNRRQEVCEEGVEPPGGTASQAACRGEPGWGTETGRDPAVLSPRVAVPTLPGHLTVTAVTPAVAEITRAAADRHVERNIPPSPGHLGATGQPVQPSACGHAGGDKDIGPRRHIPSFSWRQAAPGGPGRGCRGGRACGRPLPPFGHHRRHRGPVTRMGKGPTSLLRASLEVGAVSPPRRPPSPRVHLNGSADHRQRRRQHGPGTTQSRSQHPAEASPSRQGDCPTLLRQSPGDVTTAARDRARITPCHRQPREGTGPLSHPQIGLPSESSQDLGAESPVSAGSPGAPVTASSPARVTGLVLSLASGCRCSCAMGCVEQSRQRLWKWKGSRQHQSRGRRDGSPGWEAKLGSCQGYRHADQRQAGELAVPTPARRCQKQNNVPGGTADDQELARVQRGTIGRTRQNTHRTINPPATGTRTSLRLSRASRGRFRGERLSPRRPWLRLSQQQGPAGVRQDTGAKQTSRPPPGSKFLWFRWGRWEVNRQASHGLATVPYLPAGPGTPQPAGSGGAHDRGGCLRSRQNPGNKGRYRHGQHNAAGSGAACGHRRVAAHRGRGGSPTAGSARGTVSGGWPRQWGFGPALLFPPPPSRQDLNPVNFLGARAQLDSLHGLRGSCVQNRVVYCEPSSGGSPVPGCRDLCSLRSLTLCLSFSPRLLTIPTPDLYIRHSETSILNAATAGVKPGRRGLSPAPQERSLPTSPRLSQHQSGTGSQPHAQASKAGQVPAPHGNLRVLPRDGEPCWRAGWGGGSEGKAGEGGGGLEWPGNPVPGCRRMSWRGISDGSDSAPACAQPRPAQGCCWTRSSEGRINLSEKGRGQPPPRLRPPPAPDRPHVPVVGWGNVSPPLPARYRSGVRGSPRGPRPPPDNSRAGARLPSSPPPPATEPSRAVPA
ncbi:collagen alpha-1(III) chain-like [Haliaeetus albicilla]|uniref:collagen alpha-1(III) chain-like n=1 Tax=Haliaeetus albicilla TaxID=8969 RepID=UPI0037E90285